MVEAQADRLTEYLVSRTGTQLRAVFRYDGRRFTVHYLRDDIDGSSARERVRETLANLTSADGTREEAMVDEFGDTYVSLQMRENGVILHFPRGEQAGVVVGFEPDVAGRLSGFIHECLHRME